MEYAALSFISLAGRNTWVNQKSFQILLSRDISAVAKQTASNLLLVMPLSFL